MKKTIFLFALTLGIVSCKNQKGFDFSVLNNSGEWTLTQKITNWKKGVTEIKYHTWNFQNDSMQECGKVEYKGNTTLRDSIINCSEKYVVSFKDSVLTLYGKKYFEEEKKKSFAEFIFESYSDTAFTIVERKQKTRLTFVKEK